MHSAEQGAVLPLVDSHCHAWDYWPYDPPVPDPMTRGKIEQLIWEMDQSGVARACVVAANIELNPDNNRYVADAVARYPDRLHHIAHIDCAWEATYNAPGAADRLARLCDTFDPVGVTRYFDAKVDDWILSDEGLAFFAVAQERRLLMSISAGPAWHGRIAEIARRFPGMPILLHHIGAFHADVMTRDAAFAAMLPAITQPNVHVKISGFHYGAERFWDFPQHDTIAFVERLFDAVGARRMCWGSDYPVGRRDRGFTYPQTIECIRHHCVFLPAEDVPLVLGGTLDQLLRSRKKPL